jgi:putative ABC transport system permease protein
MLPIFIKTMFRSITKNKGYSFLNITGLAIGIACAGLIFLWVEDEVNFDTVNTKKDRLYAVRVNESYTANTLTHWSTPGILGPAIKNDIPGIANTCRMSEGLTNMLFTIGDNPIYAGGRYVEPSIFSMFTLPFVQGNASTAFKQRYSIVITEQAAKKFFGNEQNIIGKSVRLDNRQDYTISGVLKDIPNNSSIRFEWLAPFDIYFEQSDWLHKWENNSLSTYVELDAAANPTAVNKELTNYIQKHVPGSISHLFLFGMPAWHLYDKFENGKQTGGGRIEYVRLFSIIAWIILFIACINFMNLATASSEKKAREIGVRKVLGAVKKGLVLQFILEAIMMTLIAAIIAVVIIFLVLPVFNTLVQKNLVLDLANPLHIASLLAIVLACGLIAGSYPSLYLSAFNPVSVLKGVKQKAGSAPLIRKGLVVLQFTVSIVLIIGTVIIYQQIQHIKNRQLGFNKNNLLEISMHGDMKNNFLLIKNHLLNTGVVDNAAISDHETIYGGNNTDDLTWQGKSPNEKVLVSFRSVSPEFMSTSDIKLLEGRDFIPGDSVENKKGINVIITAALAKQMGTGTAVGKTIGVEGTESKSTVVGVVNDYVYGNMSGNPDPVIFICMQPAYTASVMYVRMKPQANPTQALSAIEAVIKKDNPAFPFDYRFVDEQFNGMFKSEMLVSKLSQVFATLAVIISCLGLFGLASYTAERRIKEIGIRKVLGASVAGITRLLSFDFLKLVIISAFIAFPAAWWAMNSWLQSYTYRISISWTVFVLSGILAVAIAIITISYQSIKAAISNPVKSLRSE